MTEGRAQHVKLGLRDIDTTGHLLRINVTKREPKDKRWNDAKTLKIYITEQELVKLNILAS